MYWLVVIIGPELQVISRWAGDAKFSHSALSASFLFCLSGHPWVCSLQHLSSSHLKGTLGKLPMLVTMTGQQSSCFLVPVSWPTNQERYWAIRCPWVPSSDFSDNSTLIKLPLADQSFCHYGFHYQKIKAKIFISESFELREHRSIFQSLAIVMWVLFLFLITKLKGSVECCLIAI